MHELSLVSEVVRIAEESAAGQRVTRVVLEVGALTAALPDSLRFCFDVVAEGTTVEGASLEIVEIGAAAACRSCGTTFPVEGVICQCACGSVDCRWVRGNELRIRELEVA